MTSSTLSSIDKQQDGNGICFPYFLLCLFMDEVRDHFFHAGKFVRNDHNVLQKHVFFFDRNQDGIVYPWETFQGVLSCFSFSFVLIYFPLFFFVEEEKKKKTN